MGLATTASVALTCSSNQVLVKMQGTYDVNCGARNKPQTHAKSRVDANGRRHELLPFEGSALADRVQLRA